MIVYSHKDFLPRMSAALTEEFDTHLEVMSGEPEAAGTMMPEIYYPLAVHHVSSGFIFWSKVARWDPAFTGILQEYVGAEEQRNPMEAHADILTMVLSSELKRKGEMWYDEND